MKQIFGRPESTGKFPTPVFDALFDQGGVFYSNGTIWQEQRSFLTKCFKSLEISTNLETFVNHEVAELKDWLEEKKMKGEEIYLARKLKAFMNNIMYAFISGSREETDIADIMEDWMKSVNRASTTGAMFFDIIGKIAPGWSGIKDFDNSCERLIRFCKDVSDKERKSTMQKNSLISSYLRHVESTTSQTSSFYGQVGYANTVDVCAGVMLAGSETTATTLNCLLFYLCAYPELQAKVQQEVDQVRREIGISDKKTMKFTEAVVEESLRMSSALPFGVMQELEEDLEYNEWKLKKGTILVPNIYHANNDSCVWGDPDQKGF